MNLRKASPERDAIAAAMVERMTPRERLSPRSEHAQIGWRGLPLSEAPVEDRRGMWDWVNPFVKATALELDPRNMLRDMTERTRAQAYARAVEGDADRQDPWGLASSVDEYVAHGGNRVPLPYRGGLEYEDDLMSLPVNAP